MANKYMEKYSKSLIDREIHFKAMRYHLILIRVTIIIKTRKRDNKRWEESR